MAQTNVHGMSFKLKLAVAAQAAISEDIVRNAFLETELWPVDYRFLKRLQRQNSQDKEIENASKGLAIQSHRMRRDQRKGATVTRKPCINEVFA